MNLTRRSKTNPTKGRTDAKYSVLDIPCYKKRDFYHTYCNFFIQEPEFKCGRFMRRFKMFVKGL